MKEALSRILLLSRKQFSRLCISNTISLLACELPRHRRSVQSARIEGFNTSEVSLGGETKREPGHPPSVLPQVQSCLAASLVQTCYHGEGAAHDGHVCAECRPSGCPCFFSFTSHRLAFVWQNLLTTPTELPKHTPGRFPGVILPCQRDLREGDNKEIKISCYSPSGLLCCRVHFVLGTVLRFPIDIYCVRGHVKACKVLNIYI